MAKYGKHIRPKYDELTVYLHGISFLLLLLMSADFWRMSMALSLASGRMILAAPIIIAGMYFAVLSPFLKKKRAKWEKKATLAFIVVSNLLVGFYALAVSVDPETHMAGLFQIPLVINIIYFVGLTVSWTRGTIKESDISDERPPRYQLRIITFAIILAFAMFNFVIGTPWAVTYTWCMLVGLVVKHVMDFLVMEISSKRAMHTV